MSIRRLGIGASVLALWVALLGVLAFPALAATPEAPELRVEAVTATTVTLQGVLSPNVAGEVGSYEFLYNQGVSCKGAGKASGVALGGQGEGISAPLSGLLVNTEYTVCLVVENTEGKTAESAPVSFKTALPPETPETTSPAKEITATSATFEGVLNPKTAGEEGSYEFLYRVSATECEGENATLTELMEGHLGEKVKAQATSLQPNAQYTFCLLARNRNTVGEVAVGPAVHFTTPPAKPSIESESVSSLKASGVRLEGVVNPNNQATECRLQYGTEPSLATPITVPCEPALLSGFGGQGVGFTVGGLVAKTTYYYRIVATNGTGTTEAAIEHFTTPTPPEAPTTTAPAAAITATTATLEGILNPGGGGEAGSDEFVYRRSATECQKTNPETGLPENENATPTIAAPAGKSAVTAPVEALAPGTQYTFCLLSRNEAGETALGNAVSFTTHAVAPVVGEEFAVNIASGSATLNGRINPGGGETAYSFEYGPTTSYGKSVSGEAGTGPEAVSVSAHLQGLSPGVLYHYRLVAGNEVDPEVVGPDLTFTTQLAGATFALPDGRAWEMVSPPNKEGAEVSTLRLIAGGDLQAAENGEAATYVTSRPISSAAKSDPFEPQVISRRGPRGWVSEDLATPHNKGSSKEFEEARPGSFAPRFGELQEYLVFSPDLSLAFVQPEANTPLVPGRPAVRRKPEFNEVGYLEGYVRDNATGTYSITKLLASEWYAQQVALAHGSPRCDASSSPAKGVGVDAVSRDGCYVYFNSESILAPGATGTDPLYVSHYDGGAWSTTFISSLSGTGVPAWSGFYVELSPNGRYVAFMSELGLTGYDNRDASTGELDQEVYLYDAVSNHLACVSCNPTGARPAGQFDPGGEGFFSLTGGELLVDPESEWKGHRLAGVLPEWSLERYHGAIIYQPHYLSDSGRLFFDSPDVLVPQDVNGLENVYEYEPEGTGSCGRAAGCVSLISSGASTKESAFLDASASGDDVFFITSSRLASQDYDNVYDVYDAHVCSASVPCQAGSAVSPACETSDSCKAPTTPQPGIFGAPPSATFVGAGNAAPQVSKSTIKKKTAKCRKGKRLRRGKCVKKANAKHKPAKGRK